ncbi:hypothetical protein [Haloarchaeobius sp. FL176]|uniref:hypothetical protein n=1 Tax=Haloarchaeobius sp. FL176 TaxID=2967129 RepID=UPI002147B2A2|nr:hypothetical protein [Haloarchaeobius sp. FL176]
MQALIGQFSRFAVENDLNRNDWESAAMEFGVHNIASNIDRFYRSWKWGDEDRQANTNQFLRKVAKENQDIALGIMRRLYTMTDPEPDTLQQYPALEVLNDDDREPAGISAPQISIHSECFLDIDNVPGTFYPNLVDDINRCYSLAIYDATLILTRKLLENLLIDILREQYGTQEIDLYYLPDNKRFENFSTLINNFEDYFDDFQHLSGGLDDDFIDELDAFRQDANAEAHSIETNITESEMAEYRVQAQHASQVLFRVRQNQ